MSEQPQHCIVSILPCSDIEASTAFYGRLGLSVHSDHGTYRILSDCYPILLHGTPFHDPRLARFRLLSAPIGRFRRPQRPDRDRRVGQKYRHAHGVRDVKG
jgi:catechol 2,3-dioxygenase-like lactoylglutathione lyase family enzyme